MPRGGPKQTEIVSVRLSPEDRDALSERAVICGKPISTYMRTVSLGSVPKARPGHLERKAIYHLSRIGNNLNQLARTANATGRLPHARLIEAAIEELTRAIEELA